MCNEFNGYEFSTLFQVRLQVCLDSDMRCKIERYLILPQTKRCYFYLIVSLVLLLIAFLGVFKIGYNVGLKRTKPSVPTSTHSGKAAIRHPLFFNDSMMILGALARSRCISSAYA